MMIKFYLNPLPSLYGRHVTEVNTVVVCDLFPLPDVLAGNQEHLLAQVDPDGVGVAVAVEEAGDGRVQALANLFCSNVGDVFRIKLHSPDGVSIHIFDQSNLVQQSSHDQFFFGETSIFVNFKVTVFIKCSISKCS